MSLFGAAEQLISLALTVFLTLSPSIARLTHHFLPDNPPIPSSRPLDPFRAEQFVTTVRARLHTDPRYQQAALGAPATPQVKTPDIESALANIFCTVQMEKETRTITGSGVFIDAQGIILTNAHLAQFLLLTETMQGTQTRCLIRQGDPALARYEVALLYIAPRWVAKNAHQLHLTHPSGTGEDDFALLYVTEALAGERPETFPSLPPAHETYLLVPMSVRAAGYPAEILATHSISSPLSPVIATTTISTLFTFGSGAVDLVVLAPSVIGQQGSSGGPVLDAHGTVLGIIATRGNTEKDGAQSLRALTLPYIDRTLHEDTGLTLEQTLSGDIALRASLFREAIVPHLRELLRHAS